MSVRLGNRGCTIKATRILRLTDQSNLWASYRPCFQQLGFVRSEVLRSQLPGNFDVLPVSLSPSTIPCHLSWGFLLLSIRFLCLLDIGRILALLNRMLTCKIYSRSTFLQWRLFSFVIAFGAKIDNQIKIIIWKAQGVSQ